MELVEEDDHQRLQTVLQSAKEMAQQQGGVPVMEVWRKCSFVQQKDLQLIRTARYSQVDLFYLKNDEIFLMLDAPGLYSAMALVEGGCASQEYPCL